MNKKNSPRLLPIKKNNRYFNNENDSPESFIFQTLPSFFASLRGRKKRLPENKLEWIHEHYPLATSIEPVITWIGHASFLIQVAGINIITDPLFGDASTFFPRIFPPGITIEQLPTIDLVLLSHNHRDHCDMASLALLKKNNPNITLLVPEGDRDWLIKRGVGRVLEHMWWDTYTHLSPSSSKITCTFLPAQHWSQHGLFDRNKSLWGSWMIQQNTTAIYFAGDTAYGEHFKHIAAEFPHITTALMPIGPGEPDPWMRKSHLDADQAVAAFNELAALHFIPMHWGTFQFGLDTFTGPLERLQKAWNMQELEAKGKKLTVVKIGQQVIV